MNNDGNGAGDLPPGGTPEELQAVREMILGQLVSEIAPFAPHVPEEALFRLAQVVVNEQQQILMQILPSLLDPKLVTSHPTILAEVWKQNDKEGTRVQVRAAKSQADITDVGAAVQNAMMLGLLLSPVARAVLRAWGYAYVFQQTSAPVAGGRIVMPTH